ncbi:microfibril-associated glycoprotein 4-like [Scaptodrosophila lebanonensis]|uniref:Microfibril-associated glycoprotein 4-like n=1 Tax=Drosophila lebanonensis TaxID=7225 RepID=A0A6J2TIW1_DROLE|nr:microfibril-associated glycoprotein 4-like [Scaptodrosophila lebanonensis]
MAISYISINKFGKAVENISIAEILSKIIDTNVTGVLKRFPPTCPNFSGADGVRTIKVSDLEPFEVLCGSNLFGAGWMVIQKRIDGNLNFFRNWTEYTLGFGNISHEFFIGLKKLHSITLLQQHELFVYMEDFEGGWRYALYDDFEIGNEGEFYALKKLGHYSGNAGDSLVYSRTAKFSTYDKDNDDYTESCAIKFMGAGWFKKCMQTNLNGLYLNGNYSSESGMKAKGVYWHHWHGSYYSLKTLSMMIRPKKTCPFFDGQP